MSTLDDIGNQSADLDEDTSAESPSVQRGREEIRRKLLGQYFPRMKEMGAISAEDEKLLLDAVDNTPKEDFEGWMRFMDENLTKTNDLYYNKLMDKLLELYNTEPRAISMSSIKEWDARFKNQNVHYKQREYFIENILPEWMTKWKAVAIRRKQLIDRNPQVKRISRDRVSKISEFLNENAFLNLDYPQREGLVKEVDAALRSENGSESEIYNEAKKKLHAEVALGVIGSHEVGDWLQRTVRDSDSAKDLKATVSTRGTVSLSELVFEWRKTRKRFDEIENKIASEGKPMGFDFVNDSKFLKMHFSQRLAYVEEAERRFGDISHENPLLMEIRHELDSKDWGTAEYLIGKISSGSLSKQDQAKLESLKRYLAEHKLPTGKESTKQSPENAIEELESCLALMPTNMQTLFIKAIRHGKADCLMSLDYNRVWSFEHHYLDKDKEVILREKSEEDTKNILREGHTKKLQNSDVDLGQKDAIRSYTYTGVNSPQILHVNPAGHDALVSKMESEDSPLFRYWTTLIPEGVEYGTHEYIVKHLHHRMKRCLRTLRELGITYTPGVTTVKNVDISRAEGSYALSA